MEGLTALFNSIAAILGAIGWPVLIGFIVYRFKSQLGELANRLVSLKTGSTSIEFQQGIATAKLDAIAKEAAPEVEKKEAALSSLMEINLSKEEKEKLTKELDDATTKIAKLEYEKGQLEAYLKTSGYLSPEATRFAGNIFEISHRAGRKVTPIDPRIREIVENFIRKVGVDKVLRISNGELNQIFTEETKASFVNDSDKSKGYTDPGGVLSLGQIGVINQYGCLSEFGVHSIHLLAEDMKRKERS